MSETNLNQSKRWYVVHVRAGFEKKVIQGLKERIQQEKLIDQFGEIIMPAEEVLEMRNGKKRKVPRKFFPGYILVHMHLDEVTWFLVRKFTYVLGFLGGNDKPMPLSEKEINSIFDRLDESKDRLKPKILFSPGQVVQITTGPFEGSSGVVKEVDYERKNRLIVSVIVFQRAISVELDFSGVKAA